MLKWKSKKKNTTKYYDSVKTIWIQYWILMNFSGEEENEQLGTKETIIHKFSLFCTMQEIMFQFTPMGVNF